MGTFSQSRVATSQGRDSTSQGRVATAQSRDSASSGKGAASQGRDATRATVIAFSVPAQLIARCRSVFSVWDMPFSDRERMTAPPVARGCLKRVPDDLKTKFDLAVT